MSRAVVIGAGLATLRNPVPQAIRNAALWAVGRFGPSVVLRQADFAMRWQPQEAGG